MQYLDGAALGTKTLTKDLAFQMGILLAQLHEIRTKKYGDLTVDNKLGSDQPASPISEMLDYLEESIAECKDVLPSKLLDKSRKYFDQHKINLAELDGPCLVHRDYKPGNVIVHNNRIIGIIDWENARSSFAQEDFMRMETSEWNKDNSSKESFMTGYATIRKLPIFKCYANFTHEQSLRRYWIYYQNGYLAK